MNRRLPTLMMLTVASWIAGCAGTTALRPESFEAAGSPHDAHRPPGSIPPGEPMAGTLDPALTPPEFMGPQPVDVYIQRALAENRAVQAARSNVLAMRHRIPQVTALDDPTVQNTIWPFPSNGPQYSLMGYSPYELMISQQFPWFGTLRLRGQAAEQEVNVALFELAAAQLDVVERVKRAYYALHFNQRAEQILGESRDLAEGFVEIARIRYETAGTTQQDVLRAENLVTDVEGELVTVRQETAASRAALARQLHVNPESDLQTLPDVPFGDVPEQVERLYQLAVAARPELHARLAEVARNERNIELARKRYYPNVDLGVTYGMMTREDAMSPMADGRDMVGLVVGFNLPVYRQKLAAAVCEAQARTVADARRYEDLRDETYEQIKELFAEAQARRELIELFRGTYLPRAEQTLELAEADYQTGRQDFLTLVTTWRELLQVRLQIARLESELGRALASLERVVGVQLNAHPPATVESAPPIHLAPLPPPDASGSPFAPAGSERRQPEDDQPPALPVEPDPA